MVGQLFLTAARCPALSSPSARPLTIKAPLWASSPPMSAAAFKPYSAHDAHRARLVEPERIAGAVEHQRHIRDAGKRQRIVRVVKRQDAHPQIIAPHHQRVVLFRGQLLRPQSCCLSRCKTKFCRITSFPCFLCTAKGIQHTARVNAGWAKHMGQPQPAQQRIRGRLRREKAGLPCKAAHRLSSRKCHSRMLPAMPAFRLSTRSVMGMRTVLLQAAMVSSVRPCPSLPMTTQTPPG